MSRQEEIKKASMIIADGQVSSANFVKGAQWADKTMIETVTNWLALNAEIYGGFNHGKLNEMVENCRKAMEE